MPKAVDLVNKALDIASGAEWGRRLGISRTALHAARNRGQVSPAIAFCLAEELGENALYWQAIATAEGEKDSAAKARMLARLAKMEHTFVGVVKS